MKAGELLPNTEEACRRDRRLEKAEASKGLPVCGASSNNTTAAAAGACRAQRHDDCQGTYSACWLSCRLRVEKVGDQHKEFSVSHPIKQTGML